MIHMIYLITDRCDPPDEKETMKCAICIDLKFYKNKDKYLEAGALATYGGTQIYLEKGTHYPKRMSSICVKELL